MDIDIKDQIRKNLPGEVSELLQERLELADAAEKLEKENAELGEKLTTMRGRLADAERQCAAYSAREEAITAAEQAQKLKGLEIQHQKDLLALREELVKRHQQDHLEVVKAVFANNRYKYRETSMIPIAEQNAMGGGSFVSQHPSTKDVGGEG